MRPQTAIVEPPIEQSCKQKPEYCYHCGTLLTHGDGHLHYWSEMRPAPNFPISVKVCFRCRNKWQEGEGDHGNR